MAFTSGNRRYKTNTNKGEEHGAGHSKGSVFKEPIKDDGEYSLWLEHVIEPATGAEMFWLMWYDKNGIPTIKVSSVFDRDDLRAIAHKLIEIP